MIKLAIIGTESSHAWLFASALAGADGQKMFDDISLVGIYGDPSNPEAVKGNEQIAKRSSCTCFAQEYDAFVDTADAVMITARCGCDHLRYARPYLTKGRLVWIDKPITSSVEEAYELASLAKKNGAVLYGGSSLIHVPEVREMSALVKENPSEVVGGHVTAPVVMDSPYDGFWFYSQHLMETIIAVFGYEIRSVTARKGADFVSATYHYPEYDVTALYGTDYSINLHCRNGNTHYRHIVLGADFFKPELEAFYNVIRTGESDMTLRRLIAPVILLDATIRAYEQNREIPIEFRKI